DPLKVAHQDHPKVHPRRDRRPAHRGRVKGTTKLFDPGVEASLGQHLVQLPVERMSRRLRQLVRGHPHSLLLAPASSQSHRDSCFVREARSTSDGRYSTTAVKGTFSTGC